MNIRLQKYCFFVYNHRILCSPHITGGKKTTNIDALCVLFPTRCSRRAEAARIHCALLAVSYAAYHSDTFCSSRACKVGSDRLAWSSAFSECDSGLNWYGETNYIINCRFNCFGCWSSIMLRGVTFLPHGWDVRPITTHWVNWPIRAQWAFRKKELCRNQCVLERLLLRSLFSAVIQKPMEKSEKNWVTRVMLTSGLTCKMMSSRQHSIVCCFAFLSLMQSIIG